MKPIQRKLFRSLVVIFTILQLHSYGQTQQSMNVSAGEQMKKADKELNSVYQKILKEYAAQPVFLKKFKAAQRLWVQLRDADLAAKFPDSDNGSVDPMCQAMYLETLTRDRIKFLNIWLIGIQEGDVCNGSVKIKS